MRPSQRHIARVGFAAAFAVSGSALAFAQAGGVEIVRNPATGLVAWMSVPAGGSVASAATPGGAATFEQAAAAFLNQQSSAFGLRAGTSDVAATKTSVDDDGRGFVRFQQSYKGLPIIGAELVVQMDASRNVKSVQAKSAGDLDVSTQADVTAADALKIAVESTARVYRVTADELKGSDPVLSIHDARVMGGPAASPALVWRVAVTGRTRIDIDQFVLVDAQTGRVAVQFNQINHAAPPANATQRVCDAANSKSKVPCGAADGVGNPGGSSVPDVKLAFRYAEKTYDYYALRFRRNSLDNKGLTLVSTVRYQNTAGQDFANAFWSSDLGQMVYGKDYATALDVVGHELSHGFTSFTSNLFYYYQSGSINESLSDIFGELIQRADGATGDGWLLGEDLPIGAIRNMKDPTQSSQPDRMTSTFWTGDFSFTDQGGVHTNSGVGNKAAYLITDGGNFNGRSIRGLGIDKASAIFYRVNAFMLTSSSDYADFGNALRQACTDLIGTKPRTKKGKAGDALTASDCSQVTKAVAATEMSKQPQYWPIPAEAATCPSGKTPKNVAFEKFEAKNSANFSYQPAGPNWQVLDIYASSNAHSVYVSSNTQVDDNIASTSNLAIPAGAYLRFAHYYNLYTDSGGSRAGGVVEYSVNGGAWKRVGPDMFLDNPYNATLLSGTGSALAGQKAFSAFSGGWTSSRIDLSSLSGKNVKFRFRAASDFNGMWDGWMIDDIRVYTCKNAATVAAASGE